MKLVMTSEMYFKRAVEFHIQGRLVEAEDSYRDALQCDPNFADAWNNMGCAQKDLGRFADAEVSFRATLKINPNHDNALINLAFTCDIQGDPLQALNIITGVLKRNESKAAKDIFVKCVRRVRITSINDDLRAAMVCALTAPWVRPVDLSRVAADLVKLNPSVGICLENVAKGWPVRLNVDSLYDQASISEVVSDQVLLALLGASPICDIELEQLLTMARYAMLDTAISEAGRNEYIGMIAFYSGIAQQCFINEYVYALTVDEAGRAKALMDMLIKALCDDGPIPSIWVLAVAAYFPLYSIPNANRLLGKSWPDAVRTVLVMQLFEHAEEEHYRSIIPCLTPIDDEVSLSVRQQYEANPYPRWIKAAPSELAMTIDKFIQRRFPHSDYQPVGKENDLDILIAGCGTGQHPIGKAQTFLGGRVLAIDLSLASLSYAVRKTKELGVKNIQFAQADILQLGVVDVCFDVIEAVGVLHHLGNPLDGWRVLLSCLRPGGVMRLGFYSELGRADVVAARSFILARNYGSDTDAIRRCRQDLINAKKGSGFEPALQRRDFFSTSTCRDLLFHVQESRFGLASIKHFLNENELVFLGFEVPLDILHDYRKRCPGDVAGTNLTQWQIFESDNPDTFRGMYQFWVQKHASEK